MSSLKRYILALCALLLVWTEGSAQLFPLPQEFVEWLSSEGMNHATVALAVKDLTTGDTLYSLEADRAVEPASLMKLVTTGAALRRLGGDFVMPDSLNCVDSATVRMPGLEGYNGDWLIEDIGEKYITPLLEVPDAGMSLRYYMQKTNERSLNTNAETLVYLLGGSNLLESGLDTIRNEWGRCGLDTTALIMYDGCGLAPADRLTANFLISLLEQMHDSPDFVRSLPVAGETGTVWRFLRGSRLASRARLKTGTTKSVVAYAGYVRPSNGHECAVVLVVNSHRCVISALRKSIEKMFLVLFP